MLTEKIKRLEQQRDELRAIASCLGIRRASIFRRKATRIQQKITRLRRQPR